MSTNVYYLVVATTVTTLVYRDSSASLKSKVKQAKIQDRVRNYSSFTVAMPMWSLAAAPAEHQQLAHPL